MSSNPAGLETIVSYFPEETVHLEKFDYLKDHVPEGIGGSPERRVLKEADAAEKMAVAVGQKALESAGRKPEDIDLLVAQNIGGQYVMPGLATHIHHQLGLREDAPAWNLQACCASFVDGLELARNMVKAGTYKRVMVITVTALHTDGWGVDPTNPFAAGTGDGAGAAIVSSENVEFEILSYANRTLGEIYDTARIDFESATIPELEDAELLTRPRASLKTNNDFFEFIEGKGGKNFAIDTIRPALKAAGLDVNDIDLVIPHQVHKFMLDLWKEGMREAGVPDSKWRDTWEKYGNIGAVDVAATLSELVEAGEIHKGDVIAFFVPGAGGHTPAMLIKSRIGA